MECADHRIIAVIGKLLSMFRLDRPEAGLADCAAIMPA